MNMNPPIDDSKFNKVLISFSERSLTPQEQDQVASILLHHPTLQQKYLDYLLMDALFA